MQQKEITLHVKLLLNVPGELGYINYVFEDLEYTDPDYHYVTAVRFPNWEWRDIQEGEEGYVVLRYVQEGVDKWFDGKDFIEFKNSNIIFMKFMKMKEENNEITTD